MLIYIKLVLMSIFWGAAFVGVRYISQFLSPISGASVRFLIATISLAFIIKTWSNITNISRVQWLFILLLALTGVFGYNVLFFIAMKNVEASRAALIIAVNPAIIALSSVLFMADKLTKKQVIGVLFALLGAVAVIGNNNWSFIFGVGELALLGCIAVWIVFSLAGKKILTELDTLTVVFLSTALGSIILIIAAISLESPFTELSTLPISAWLWLFVVGTVSTATGNLWYYQGIATIGTTQASNFISFVPIFATIFGIIFLDETPTLSLLAGGVLIIIGVYLVNKKTQLSSGKKTAKI